MYPRIPSTESIDAFVLNIRFFYLKNESCSVEYLPKNYYALDVNKEYVERLKVIRRELNKWLNTSALIGHSDKPNTNKYFLETYIHGYISNSTKLSEYQFWQNSKIGNASIQVQGCIAIGKYFDYLLRIYELNTEVLKSLKI